MASSHPSITIDEYKKLLADSAKSGRLQTLRRMSYVDKIYDYVNKGTLPMVRHKRTDLPPEYTSFISMLRSRLYSSVSSPRTIENYVDAVWSFCAYLDAHNVLSFKNVAGRWLSLTSMVQTASRAVAPFLAGYVMPS